MRALWFRSMVLPALLLVVLSGCASQAAIARYERDDAWRMLGPDRRAKLIAQSCGETGPNPQAYELTSCYKTDPHLPPGPRHCTTTRIAPVMSQQQLYQDTKSTVTATCRKLSDTALRGGTTHQAWCASFVPGLLPQGLTIDQAKERAGTCYAATLRREGDAASARKTKCCEARERIGSNGVWACLNDELDRLDLAHDDDACTAALGGVQPYGAALWCGICANPNRFLDELGRPGAPTETEAKQ